VHQKINKFSTEHCRNTLKVDLHGYGIFQELVGNKNVKIWHASSRFTN